MYYYRLYYPTCIEQNFGNLRNRIKNKWLESQGIKTCRILKHHNTDLQLNLQSSSLSRKTELQFEKHEHIRDNCKHQQYFCKHVSVHQHLKQCRYKYSSNNNFSSCVKCHPTTSCSYHRLPLNCRKNVVECDCKFRKGKISNDTVSAKHKNLQSTEMGSDSSKIRNLSVSKQNTYDNNYSEKLSNKYIYEIQIDKPIGKLVNESRFIKDVSKKIKMKKVCSNISTSLKVVYQDNSIASSNSHYCNCNQFRNDHSVRRTYNQKYNCLISDALQPNVSEEVFKKSIDSSGSSINYMEALNIKLKPRSKPVTPTVNKIQIHECNSRRNNGKPVKNYLHRNKPKLSVTGFLNKIKNNNLTHFHKHDDQGFKPVKNKSQNCNLVNSSLSTQYSKQNITPKETLSGVCKYKERNVTFERNNEDFITDHYNNTQVGFNNKYDGQNNPEMLIAINQKQTNQLPRTSSENNPESSSTYNSEESMATVKETIEKSNFEESKGTKEFRQELTKLRKNSSNSKISTLKLVHPIRYQTVNKRNRMMYTLNKPSSYSRTLDGKNANSNKDKGEVKGWKEEVCAYSLDKLSSSTTCSSKNRVSSRILSEPRIFRKKNGKLKTIRSKRRITCRQKNSDSYFRELNQHCMKKINLDFNAKSRLDTKGICKLKPEPEITALYIVKVGSPAGGEVQYNRLNLNENLNRQDSNARDLLTHRKSLSDEESLISCSICGTLYSNYSISSSILLACQKMAAKHEQSFQKDSTTFNNHHKKHVKPEEISENELKSSRRHQCTCGSKPKIPAKRNACTMVDRQRHVGFIGVSSNDSSETSPHKMRNSKQKEEDTTLSSSEYVGSIPYSCRVTDESADTTSTSSFDSVITFQEIKKSFSDGLLYSSSSYDIESIAASKNIIDTESYDEHSNHSSSNKGQSMLKKSGSERMERHDHNSTTRGEINENLKKRKRFNNYNNDYFKNKVETGLPSRKTFADNGDHMAHRSCTCYVYPSVQQKPKSNNYLYKSFKNNENSVVVSADRTPANQSPNTEQNSHLVIEHSLSLRLVKSDSDILAIGTKIEEKRRKIHDITLDDKSFYNKDPRENYKHFIKEYKIMRPARHFPLISDTERIYNTMCCQYEDPFLEAKNEPNEVKTEDPEKKHQISEVRKLEICEGKVEKPLENSEAKTQKNEIYNRSKCTCTTQTNAEIVIKQIPLQKPSRGTFYLRNITYSKRVEPIKISNSCQCSMSEISTKQNKTPLAFKENSTEIPRTIKHSELEDLKENHDTTRDELAIISTNVEDKSVQPETDSAFISDNKVILPKSDSDVSKENTKLTPSQSFKKLSRFDEYESEDGIKAHVSSDTFISNEIKSFVTMPQNEPEVVKSKRITTKVRTRKFDTCIPPTVRKTYKPLPRMPQLISVYDKSPIDRKTQIPIKTKKEKRSSKFNIKPENSKVYFRITRPRSYNKNYRLNITPIRRTHKCCFLDLICSPPPCIRNRTPCADHHQKKYPCSSRFMK